MCVVCEHQRNTQADFDWPVSSWLAKYRSVLRKMSIKGKVLEGAYLLAFDMNESISTNLKCPGEG